MIKTLAQILNQNDVNLPNPAANQTTFTHILNIIFAVMGALAFFMLVLAGFRYTISQGDPTRVADSKRMIIYTIVGLVVIALAATLVNFVLERT